MPGTGTNQILKIANGAEVNYGDDDGEAFLCSPIGIVEDGEVAGRTGLTKIFGIGSDGYQAIFAGAVENSLRAVVPCPSQIQMNKAITRTNGILGSFNFLVGLATGANAWHGCGLKWDSLDLEVDSTNPLKATLAGIFKSILTVDNTTVGHDPGTVKVWHPQALELKIGDAPTLDVDIMSCRIGVRNNLTAQNVANAPIAGAKRVLKYLKEGNLEIDATIETLTVPEIHPTELQADGFGCGLPVELQLKFTNLCPAMPTVPEVLTILCEGGVFTELTQPLRPGEYVNWTVGATFQTITISEGPA